MSLKRWQKTGLASLLGIALVTLAQVSRAANDDQARESVEKVARLFSSKSSIATVKMQITNEDGTRDVLMKIWSLGDKVLVSITSPKDEAGTTILKVGKDISYYLPKSNRTVKVPASMALTSWMGSNFSIDDLVKQSFLTRDYSIVTSFEGKRGGIDVIEYALTPKPDAVVVWGKIIVQVRQADLVPTWQGYYSEDGALLRDLTFSEYKKVGGRIIPTRLVMRPADKPGEQTTIDYQDIAFDVPVSDGTFSLAGLKR